MKFNNSRICIGYFALFLVTFFMPVHAAHVDNANLNASIDLGQNVFLVSILVVFIFLFAAAISATD